MKRIAIALLTALMVLGATTAASALDKVTLQLKWLPQAQFMGYYVAAAKGYYKDEGLDVTLLPGGPDIIPEQQVFNGVADIGVTWVSSFLKYQEKGWGFLEVAQPFQKSAMLLVSKASSGIKTPKDLIGKKVGSWFGGNEYELYALMESAGINKDKDLKLVQQDFTMDQVKKGDVDAASAMIYNEYGLLLESGFKPADLNVLDMNAYGVAMLEDNLFVTGKWAKANGDKLVKFLRATIKGWADAVKDPEGAGKIVFDADKSVSLPHQVYMAKEIARLVVPAGFDATKIGFIDPKAFQQTADFALKYGLLTKPAAVAAAYDDSYWKKATMK